MVAAGDTDSKPVCTVLPATQSDAMRASDADVVQSHLLVSCSWSEFCVALHACHVSLTV